MIEFSQLLKERREAAGLSLQKLSKIAGIKDSTISKIENEKSPNPKWDTVCALTKALGFSTEEFLALAGYAPSNENVCSSVIQGAELLSNEELSTVQLFVDFLLHRKQPLGEGGNH